MIRRLVAAVTAVALLLVLAVPVLAGGWAAIVPDTQTTPPVEDQPTKVGFLVLQHGETPVPWETATVHFTNASTGTTIDVIAVNDRDDGHFTATAVLPAAGYWSWEVTLKDLATDPMAVALAVRSPSGTVPALDPGASMLANAEARRQMTDEVLNQVYPDIERLDAALRAEQSRTDRLVQLTNEITAERDALATRLQAAENGGSVPVLAILTLAVLAGATAGFAMTWLAGRPGPRVTAISATPQGVDPA